MKRCVAAASARCAAQNRQKASLPPCLILDWTLFFFSRTENLLVFFILRAYNLILLSLSLVLMLMRSKTRSMRSRSRAFLYTSARGAARFVITSLALLVEIEA